MAHIADPSRSWRPVDSSDPDYRYLTNPDTSFWYMYRHPERPSKETILRARDKMMEKHPNLRIVGAHFGSMEEDVDDIARRLDRYPNFAVETGGWQQEFLSTQPREKVRAFLIKYQDRVFYGTDELVAPWRRFAFAEYLKMIEDTFALDWKYFATAETVEILGRKVQGLALPEPVLRKFYHDNVIQWFPDIVKEPLRDPA
jgi:predicted TIM-barrel fold metal-dependent hydrolase